MNWIWTLHARPGRALPLSKTCLSPRFSTDRRTSSDANARGAAIRPIAIRSTPAAYTTWAIEQTTPGSMTRAQQASLSSRGKDHVVAAVRAFLLQG
jgi:hypothetical protein